MHNSDCRMAIQVFSKNPTFDDLRYLIKILKNCATIDPPVPHDDSESKNKRLCCKCKLRTFLLRLRHKNLQMNKINSLQDRLKF